MCKDEFRSLTMVVSCLNTWPVLNLNFVIESDRNISSIWVKQAMAFPIIYIVVCVIRLIHFPWPVLGLTKRDKQNNVHIKIYKSGEYSRRDHKLPTKLVSTPKKKGEPLTKTSTTVSTPRKRDIGRPRRRRREMDHLKANQFYGAVPIAQNLQHTTGQNYILFLWMYLKQ